MDIDRTRRHCRDTPANVRSENPPPAGYLRPASAGPVHVPTATRRGDATHASPRTTVVLDPEDITRRLVRLADEIAVRGPLRSEHWAHAVLDVARHGFVPGYWIEDRADSSSWRWIDGSDPSEHARWLDGV